MQVLSATLQWSATFSVISGGMLKTLDIFPNMRISYLLFTYFMGREKKAKVKLRYLLWSRKSSLGLMMSSTFERSRILQRWFSFSLSAGLTESDPQN